MHPTEQILLENTKEYTEFALGAFQQGKFNSATTLYFKALVALCDLYLFRKEGIIPSSHSQRFKILEEKYPLLYQIVDRDFPFY